MINFEEKNCSKEYVAELLDHEAINIQVLIAYQNSLKDQVLEYSKTFFDKSFFTSESKDFLSVSTFFSDLSDIFKNLDLNYKNCIEIENTFNNLKNESIEDKKESVEDNEKESQKDSKKESEEEDLKESIEDTEKENSKEDNLDEKQNDEISFGDDKNKNQDLEKSNQNELKNNLKPKEKLQDYFKRMFNYYKINTSERKYYYLYYLAENKYYSLEKAFKFKTNYDQLPFVSNMFNFLMELLKPVNDTNNNNIYKEYEGPESFGYLIYDDKEYINPLF